MDSQEGSKKEKEKINELIKSLVAINSLLKSLNIPQEILEKEIKPFGNASHIILPKEYTSKKAWVIIGR